MSKPQFKIGEPVEVVLAGGPSYITGVIEEITPEGIPFVRYVNGNGTWVQPSRIRKP